MTGHHDVKRSRIPNFRNMASKEKSAGSNRNNPDNRLEWEKQKIEKNEGHATDQNDDEDEQKSESVRRLAKGQRRQRENQPDANDFEMLRSRGPDQDLLQPLRIDVMFDDFVRIRAQVDAQRRAKNDDQDAAPIADRQNVVPSARPALERVRDERADAAHDDARNRKLEVEAALLDLIRGDVVVFLRVDERFVRGEVQREEHEGEGQESRELGVDVGGFVVGAVVGFHRVGDVVVGGDETTMNVRIVFFGPGRSTRARGDF